MRVPDSDRTTTNDGATHRRSRTNDLTTESEQPTLPDPGGDPSRVSKVRHEPRRTSLEEILGAPAAHRPDPADRPPGHAQAATTVGILEIQEETARRIAQSLHDEASQMLALVYLELAHIARQGTKSTAERIDRVVDHLDTVCEQIRGLSHEWHPIFLERHGLVPALRKLADGVSKRSGLEVVVIGEVDDLPAAIETGLYRVVQEALSNAVRHAGASKAEVRLWSTGNRVHCSVKDDGKGFPPVGPASGDRYVSGLGLVGIHERVDSLGGECHILSDERQGMELIVGIPM